MLEALTPNRGRLIDSRYKQLFWVLVATAVLLFLSLKIASLNLTPESIRAAVLELGVLAPLGMIFLEWLQVVAAPIPPVTMVASGYTFGVVDGFIYSFIGLTLGSWTAIFLGRRFGQPVVDKVVSQDHMDRFHHLTDEHGLLVFTVIFLAPGFPDDIVCYIAGLTDLDFKQLMAAASLGRAPTVVALVLTGDSIAVANIKVLAATLGIFVGTGIICVRKEEWIIEKASHLEQLIEEAFVFW